jgi:hypothetical protein
LSFLVEGTQSEAVSKAPSIVILNLFQDLKILITSSLQIPKQVRNDGKGAFDTTSITHFVREIISLSSAIIIQPFCRQAGSPVGS